MNITGIYRLPAPPSRVWDLLMRPDVVASCIPGCGELVPEGPDRYRATIVVGLAAITGTYEGTVEISARVPATSYRLTIEGQGKPGCVKGSATIVLRPDEAGTLVDVSGTVQTSGPIARLGQRLMSGVAKMMQDRFFACLASKI